MSCEYCHEDRDGYVVPLEKNGHAFLKYPDKLVFKLGKERRECKIRFCPMCGRELSKSKNGCKSEFKTIEKVESDTEIRGVRIDDLDVCKWESFNGWKAKRAFTDYPQNGAPRKEVVVVFVREE